MLAVGAQGDGAVARADLDQDPPDDAVEDGGHDRNGEADAERSQRPGVEQAIDAQVDDRGRGDEDHDPFQRGGEILRLAVVEVVVVVGRPGGDGQRDQGDDGGHQVDHRFGGVRQQAHRAGDRPGAALEQHRQHRGHDGQPGVFPQVRRGFGRSVAGFHGDHCLLCARVRPAEACRLTITRVARNLHVARTYTLSLRRAPGDFLARRRMPPLVMVYHTHRIPSSSSLT